MNHHLSQPPIFRSKSAVSFQGGYLTHLVNPRCSTLNAPAVGRSFVLRCQPRTTSALEGVQVGRYPTWAFPRSSMMIFIRHPRIVRGPYQKSTTLIFLSVFFFEKYGDEYLCINLIPQGISVKNPYFHLILHGKLALLVGNLVHTRHQKTAAPPVPKKNMMVCIAHWTWIHRTSMPIHVP